MLSWVTVSVSPLLVEVGKTGLATGAAFDQNGAPFGAAAFTYSSSAPLVAAVDVSGTIRGLAPGTAVITAATAGKTASHDVTIVPVAVARVQVSPALLNLDPGDSTTLVVTMFDADGAVLTGHGVTWTSSDTTTVVVTNDGRALAIKPGRAKITAASGDRSDAAVVTVRGEADAGDLVISFAVPAPGEIVGDTLEVYANVSSTQPIAQVVAMFNGVALTLVKVPAGALGGSWLWYGSFDISTVRFGLYYVLVTATDARGATVTDSVLFERDTRKKGGGSLGPEKKDKVVAPSEPPKPDTTSVPPAPPDPLALRELHDTL